VVAMTGCESAALNIANIGAPDTESCSGGTPTARFRRTTGNNNRPSASANPASIVERPPRGACSTAQAATSGAAARTLR